VGGDIISFDFVKYEHPAHRHLIGGEGSGLIRADDRGASQGFYGWQAPDNSVLLGHSASSKSQASGDDSGQTLRNGSDGKSNSDLEVIYGSLDP